MTIRTKAHLGAPLHEVITTGPMTFSMIEKQALLEMDHLIATEPHAARILNHLIRLSEPGSGGVVVISRGTLARLLGVSDPTVGRALRVLVEGKWVQRMRIGGAYALAINSSVAWTGPRGQLNRAVFRAVVVASREEQDQQTLDMRQEDLRRVPSTLPGDYVLPTGEATPPAQEVIPGTEFAPPAGADLPSPFAGMTQAQIDAERTRIYQAGLEARGQLRIDNQE